MEQDTRPTEPVTYPYVIWTQRGGAIRRTRLVATSPGMYMPETRQDDDALGNPVWTPDTWGCLWWADLAAYLLERFTGVPSATGGTGSHSHDEIMKTKGHS